MADPVNYVLKHKNIPVLRFSIDSDFKLSKINEIINEERLPFIIEQNNKENSCYSLMYDWLKYRGISKSREDYIEILFETGASSGIELSINSLGLNLSDQYWLHKEDQNHQWEKHNFFDNSFKEIILKDIFDSKEDSVNIHPDFSVDGNLTKNWVCYKNDRYLLKKGRTKENQEPYNEVISSEILDFYDIDHVKYNIKKMEGKIVSACKCMVDKNTELIPAQYVFDKESNVKNDPYNHFINVCSDYGIKDIKDKLDEMIILDCIIGNEDRHKRNFGIIRNADTLKWEKFAPIFDNGNSFCFRKSADMVNLEKRTDSYCKWTSQLFNYKGNLENLKYIDYSKWLDRINPDTIIDIVADGFAGKINDEKKDKIIIITKNRLNFVEKYLLEKRNIIAAGFNNNNPKELERTAYVQGVAECIVALGDNRELGKKMLKEINVTKEEILKLANPKTVEKLTQEGGIFSSNQELNYEQKPDTPAPGQTPAPSASTGRKW